LLRRGFKAQCERRSLEVRRTLGISARGSLSAERLADHMGVTVWAATMVRGLSEADQRHLLDTARDEWSAFVLQVTSRHLIVYNPQQSLGRLNSVLMHELSHIMLGHELAEAKQTADGHFMNGSYDQEQEDEATWLGGTLLLPRPALIWIRGEGITEEEACRRFEVSSDMLRWRIRMTGVDYQLAQLLGRRRGGVA
jgi:Zn-dependent peptidase ImmA (M78 family)